MENDPWLTADGLRTARERIAGHVHRTPVFTSESLDRELGCRLFFKCENLQKTGSFKPRGAMNAVASLSPAVAGHGVVTHSSGNHGAALAWAAARHGVECTVVMPQGASPFKRAAVERYGAEIVTSGSRHEDRVATADEVIDRTGATLIHPYDDPIVIAGQASCCAELLEQVDDLDLVVVPVGGGGLLAGSVLAGSAEATESSEVELIGAEPAIADDAARSVIVGRIVPQIADGGPDTVADGLRATIGALPLAILVRHGVYIGTVEEEEILEATAVLWQRLKLVVEPSGAVPLALVRSGRLQVSDRRIGIILSGGNVAPSEPGR